MSDEHPTKCPIHPKYKGKKKPRYCDNEECVCHTIYLRRQMYKKRSEHRPTKVMKDKSKYTRKTKHKDRDDEQF